MKKNFFDFDRDGSLFPIYDWGPRSADYHSVRDFQSVAADSTENIVVWLALSSVLLEPSFLNITDLNTLLNRTAEMLQEKTGVHAVDVMPEADLLERMKDNAPVDDSYATQREWYLGRVDVQWAVLLDVLTLDAKETLQYTIYQPMEDPTVVLVEERVWQRCDGVNMFHSTHFLSFQNAVEETIDSVFFNLSSSLDMAIFRYGPEGGKDKEDLVRANLIHLLMIPTFGMVTCVGIFAMTSVRMTAALVALRSTGTQRYLQINGMSNSAYYFAFLLSVVLPRLLFVPILAYVMTHFFFPGMSMWPMCFVMILYLVSLVPFAALTSLLCGSQLSAWFISFGLYLLATAAGIVSAGCGDSNYPLDQGKCFDYWFLFPPLPPTTFVQAMTAIAQDAMRPYNDGKPLYHTPDPLIFLIVLCMEGIVSSFLAWWVGGCVLKGRKWDFFFSVRFWRRKWEAFMQPPDDTGLAAQRVTVSIKGKTILSDVSLSVEAGEKVALLGHNGAGKTTFIRVATGGLDCETGEVTLCGLPIGEACGRGFVGYCPQDEVLPDLSIRQFLELFACFRGISLREIAAHAEAVAVRFSLKEMLNLRLKAVSLGIRKKVAVAVAFLGKPSLVILDEPTAGLDPRSCKEVWEVAQCQRDVACLFTTHLLDEAEISDSVCIMSAGRLPPAHVGTMSELKQRFQCGHKLVILKKNASVENAPILDLVHRHIPIMVEDEAASCAGSSNTHNDFGGEGGREVVIPLPLDTVVDRSAGLRALSNLVQELQSESLCYELDIESFSLKKSGLEEAMVRITDPCGSATVARTEKTPESADDYGSGFLKSLKSIFSFSWHETASDAVSNKSTVVDAVEAPPIYSPLLSETYGSLSTTNLKAPFTPLDTELGTALNSSGLQINKSKIHSRTFSSASASLNGALPSLLGNSACFLSIPSQIWVMIFYIKLPSMFGSGKFFLFQLLLPMVIVAFTAPFTFFRYGAGNEGVLSPVNSLPTNQGTVYFQGNGSEDGGAVLWSFADMENVATDLSAVLLPEGRDWQRNSTIREAPFVVMVNAFGIDHIAPHIPYTINGTVRNVSMEVNVWFNASVVHALPYALNYLHNSARIGLGHEPVISRIGILPTMSSVEDAFWSYLLFFALAISILTGMFTGRLVKDRATGARSLTQLCGVHDTVFYIACGLTDALISLTVIVACFFYISLYSERLRRTDIIPCYILLFVMCTPTILAFNYTVSYAFRNGLLATVFTTCFHMIVAALCLDYIDEPHASNFFQKLSPLAVLVNAMVYLQNASKSMLSDMRTHPKQSILDMATPYLLILLYEFLIWTFLLMLCESSYKLKNIMRWVFPRPEGYYEREAILADIVQDASVAEERRNVERSLRRLAEVNTSQQNLQNLSFEDREMHNTLFVKQLRKVFGKQVAVSGMYLTLKPGDCFGLLSPPGAGKSTLLSMVAGLLSPSQGEVTIRGLSNLRPLQLKNLQKLVGYLPQTDPLPPELTVKQVVRYYAKIKGIPGVNTASIAEVLQHVGLLEYSGTKCMALSGGAKRLLALTVVLLGNPSILLLDNPTSAMDPTTRERAWRLVMSKLRPIPTGNPALFANTVRPIVFMSTGSLKEAESICTRFGVLVDGHLTTIGTPKQLKDRLAKGYFVNIYFAPPKGLVKADDKRKVEFCARSLLDELMTLSPKAELLETIIGRRQIEIQLPLSSDLSELLRMLESKQEEYGIDEFSVSKASFEQAYLRAVELQQKANLKKKDLVAQSVVPPLKIVILIVGSRGDVQPFLALAKRLRDFKHCIRIATHECFRGFVQSHGFEFFPIGGDPEALMKFIVENPKMITTSLSAIQANRQMMSEMFRGCWAACDSFSPDVIIANPPVQCHTHIAEALHVPLQIHFTMPWSPTKAYLHPLAVVSVFGNEQSYHIVDELMWLGMSDLINVFRTSIGLPRIKSGAGLQHTLKIPHIYCVSECLLPKPADWGPHITTSGFWFLNDAKESGGLSPALGFQTPVLQKHLQTLQQNFSPNQDRQYEPPSELNAFITAADTPLIYIGFGSIVVQDKVALETIIFEAISLLRDEMQPRNRDATQEEMRTYTSPQLGHHYQEPTGTPQQQLLPEILRRRREVAPNDPVRIILHSGWANLGCLEKGEEAGTPLISTDVPANVFVLRTDVSHDWLFPRCSAVVHHGGAGTTAAGLRAGKPTVVIPFFGDQTFWGTCVERQGVGPAPIHHKDLTASSLCKALHFALQPSTRRQAEELGFVLSAEAGVEKGVRAFHSYLPLDFEGRWRVSCFENQRWFPVIGWSATLYKTDPSPFSDSTGLQVANRERYPCPDGWRWDGEWRPVTSPETDAEGFQHATSFKGPWKRSCASTDVVRRRGWVRKRSFHGHTRWSANDSDQYLTRERGGSTVSRHPYDEGDETEALRTENALLRQKIDLQSQTMARLIKGLADASAGNDTKLSQLCSELSVSVGNDSATNMMHTGGTTDSALTKGCFNLAELLSSVEHQDTDSDVLLAETRVLGDTDDEDTEEGRENNAVVEAEEEEEEEEGGGPRYDPPSPSAPPPLNLDDCVLAD